MMKYLKGFLNFWWEFLVGDTPEIFVGILVVLGVADLLVGRSTLAAYVLVLLVALTVIVSVWVELERKIKKARQ